MFCFGPFPPTGSVVLWTTLMGCGGVRQSFVSISIPSVQSDHLCVLFCRVLGNVVQILSTQAAALQPSCGAAAVSHRHYHKVQSAWRHLDRLTADADMRTALVLFAPHNQRVGIVCSGAEL